MLGTEVGLTSRKKWVQKVTSPLSSKISGESTGLTAELYVTKRTMTLSPEIVVF